ncbi:MAG: hypothetical protein GWP35_10945 [Proteobacteria bacterium]|nr:hypothetical protein [Pseudomonadota bacterium]
MSEIVYVGMDLGTSRTSITTSTGIRTTVWSYVGYAQDHVSKKLLGGRDKVFGEEAVENRMSVNLVRPLDKGVIRDEVDAKRATRDLIEHIIELAEIPSGSTVYGVMGAPAEASVDSKAHILEAASEFMDSIIVCSEPFSVAYGLDFLADTLVIDIGAGTVDLCRVHGTMPKAEDQRTHHFGGDAIDQKLFDLISEKYTEAQFSTNMVREIKENFANVGRQHDSVLATFPVKVNQQNSTSPIKFMKHAWESSNRQSRHFRTSSPHTIQNSNRRCGITSFLVEVEARSQASPVPWKKLSLNTEAAK